MRHFLYAPLHFSISFLSPFLITFFFILIFLSPFSTIWAKSGCGQYLFHVLYSNASMFAQLKNLAKSLTVEAFFVHKKMSKVPIIVFKVKASSYYEILILVWLAWLSIQQL